LVLGHTGVLWKRHGGGYATPANSAPAIFCFFGIEPVDLADHVFVAGLPGAREKVSWADVARIDRLLMNSAAPPPLESNSMLVLFSHVQAGGYACVVPEKLSSVLSLTESLRAIPIVEPREIYTIGLVSARREPIPPLTRALAAEASRLAMPQKQASRRYPY
jgi:DNA-binding transcriptional LysR family regulator